MEDENISEFLSAELCEDAGIIVIDIEDDILSLGAMNLDYIKVKEVINTIESKFKLKVNFLGKTLPSSIPQPQSAAIQ